MKMFNPDFDELMTIKEASLYSGLSAAHLRRLVENGDIWGKKIGNSWATTKAAIDDYLKLNKKPGPKPKKD